MVAKIVTGSSIRGALAYNENKVREKKAEVLKSGNIPPGLEGEDISIKAAYFRILTDSNKAVSTNAVHINVNFAPQDEVSNEQMRAIAQKVMEGIEFGRQPYLLYRHYDAGHAHMHMVTTNVDADGNRISDSNNAYKLRSICEETEKKYGFTKTGRNVSQKQENLTAVETLLVKPIQYPDPQLRKNISAIVVHVTRNESYNGIEQLNDRLALYHVKAIVIRNPTGERKGMMFSALQAGRTVGAPIRSSDLLYAAKGFVQDVYNRMDTARQQQDVGQLQGVLAECVQGKVIYNKHEMEKVLHRAGFQTIEEKPLSWKQTGTAHVLELNDLTDTMLQKGLVNKRGEVDLTTEEHKVIFEVIADQYKAFRKTHLSSHPLHSKFIEDLPNLNFEPFSKEQQQIHDQKKLEIVHRQFISHLLVKKPDVEAEEKNRFRQRVVQTLEYFDHLEHSSRDRVTRLLGFTLAGNHLQDSVQGTVLASTRFAGLQVSIQESFPTGNVVIAESNLDQDDVVLFRHYIFKQADEESFREVISKKAREKTLPSAYDYLREADKRDFESRMTIELFKQVNLGKPRNVPDLLQKLGDNKILVKPEKDGSYWVGFHGFAESSFIPAPRQIADLMHNSFYKQAEYISTVKRMKGTFFQRQSEQKQHKLHNPGYDQTPDYGDISENQLKKQRKRKGPRL